MEDIQPTTATSSPLFRLPGELRNVIYEQVLEEDTHFCIHDMLHECYIRSQLKVPPLLHVCHQIRKETVSIWFSETIFQYHNLPQLERWLKALLPPHRDLIRTIRKWHPLFSLIGLDREMLDAREIFAKLGMVKASQVMVVGCMRDENGVARSSQSARWFRGPGQIMSEGPVECALSSAKALV